MAAKWALVAVLAMAACTPSPQGTDRIRVAATVSPITDLVSAVAGDRATVFGMVPEGVDSHTFEPSARAAAALADSRLLFANGLHLETPILELARKTMGHDTKVVELGDKVITAQDWIFDRSFPREEKNPNPHLWTDPVLAMGFVDEIARELIAIDPGGRTAYERRAEGLREAIRGLDAAIRTATATIDPSRRKLLSYHDSFPYFARRYGWQVIGAVQPSDFKEPTAREVADLITQIRRESVPAIFGSEVYPSSVLRTIAEETGARYIADLRDDDLPGEPGDPNHSYIGLMRYNLITIVEGLGGDASALKELSYRPPR